MRNLSGSGTLWFDLSSIDDMRPILHELIDHRGARVGDESEASRTTGLTVLHDNMIDKLSVLAKVGLERVIVGLVAEASDEHFAELLGLQRAAVIGLVGLVSIAVLLAGAVLLTVAIAVSVVTRLVLRVAVVRAHVRLVLAVVLLLLLRLVLLRVLVHHLVVVDVLVFH